jgi:hypothetical protein
MSRLTQPTIALRIAAVLGTVAAALLLAGCASTVLPGSTSKTQTQWPDYEAAKASYDKIKVGAATEEDVHALGFDPAKIPNVKLINYVDVVNIFGASFRMDDLPSGIRACVSAREDCRGYAIVVRDVQSQRDGNIPADLLGFQKNIHTTGWEFNTTIVMVDGKVVYKLWNGTPDINSRSHEFTPLGPMQNMGGIIPKPF